MKRSAGLMMYRLADDVLEVLLVHPGGPFFRNKDDGAWTIPKGEIEGPESAVETARREFSEETGLRLPTTELIELGEIKQKGGKAVIAWAFEGDCDVAEIESNQFELEWPPRSGRVEPFPEIDRAAFFDIDQARDKLNPAQTVFLERLQSALARRP